MHYVPCSVLVLVLVLVLVHTCVVPCPPFPVPLHPPLPDLCAMLALPSLWGGGGSQWERGSCRNAAKKNILRPRGGYPLWGRG